MLNGNNTGVVTPSRSKPYIQITLFCYIYMLEGGVMESPVPK